MDIVFDKTNLKDVFNIYKLCKYYTTIAEETLEGMSAFIPPLFEYRDALDHLLKLIDSNMNDVDQYLFIKGHMERAFFDIVDFICIKVREEISLRLKPYQKKKIIACWEEYAQIQSEVYDISIELANIRRLRGWKSTEDASLYANGDVERYKTIADKFLAVFENFIKNIEPKLKK